MLRPSLWAGSLMFVACVLVFLWTRDTGPTVAQTKKECPQVSTVGRNPETGERSLFASLCAVPQGWGTIASDRKGVYEEKGEVGQRFLNEELGLSFRYRMEPRGYTMLSTIENEHAEGGPFSMVTLIDTEEHLAMQMASSPREGPPTIAALLFYSEAGAALEEFLRRGTLYTNAREETIFERATLSGIPALKYSFDGLYPHHAVAVEKGGVVYVFTGAYNEVGDRYDNDFKDFLKTVDLF